MFLIYGANGYTGELIAREASRRGLKFAVAGRSRVRIEPLARELQVGSRVFDLGDAAAVAPNIEGVDAVLHCAGPFSHTSAPMVQACLDAGVSYLDITGEMPVFESIFRLDSRAKERGVALIPGVGFDVVPTDCLAAMLNERMPGAEELWLAFYSPRAEMSRGTTKTMIENIGAGGAVRSGGKIVRVPLLFDVREIPFSIGPRLCMTIPWGDVATAYRTTGIPDIRVYTGTSPKSVRQLRLMRPLLPIASLRPVNALLQKIAERRSGPDAAKRATGKTYLWGRVTKSGSERSMTMTTPEGYAFTVLAALAAVERLTSSPVRGGAWTPATYFGAEFVRRIPGVVID